MIWLYLYWCFILYVFYFFLLRSETSLRINTVPSRVILFTDEHFTFCPTSPRRPFNTPTEGQLQFMSRWSIISESVTVMLLWSGAGVTVRWIHDRRYHWSVSEVELVLQQTLIQDQYQVHMKISHCNMSGNFRVKVWSTGSEGLLLWRRSSLVLIQRGTSCTWTSNTDDCNVNTVCVFPWGIINVSINGSHTHTR